MRQCMPRIKFCIAITAGVAIGEADAIGCRLEFAGTIDTDGAFSGTVTGWETIQVRGRH